MNRNDKKTEYVPDYVPNYKKLNVNPVNASPQSGDFVISRGSPNNPRERAVPRTRTVPFAEAPIEDNFPIGIGPVPNIGNNIEHTWSGVDVGVIDDIGLGDDLNPMIDNNDFVEIEKIASQHKKITAQQMQHLQNEDVESYKTLSTFVDTTNLGEYSLLIFGQFYSSGSLEEIQKEVTDILYNQHAINKVSNVTLDDIAVLKKMNIKFGVFIGEE